MAIPGPGTAISINTIATEFGGTTPHSISEYYRGGGLVPNTPGNAAIPTSGQIALGDFYGSANRNAYTLTISANTQNYDVYTNRGPAYIAGSTDITVQINPGVTVGSSTVPAYAFLVPSAFNPGDSITVVNNGNIYGAGGNGGNGANSTGGNGATGTGGGNSIYVNRPTTITNNGIIAGGGGGGGGGAAAGATYTTGKNFTYFGTSGGGGGGGAGNNVGSGGTSGANDSSGATGGSPGSSGTATTGGAGGAGGTSANTNPPNTGGNGGTGGGSGSAGSKGGDGNVVGVGPVATGGSGGAAGNYITGNSLVTWPATGTRYGGVA